MILAPILAALVLSACGGGSSAKLLPGTTASQINQNLEQVRQAVSEGDCTGAEDAAAAVATQVDELGSGVDAKLKAALVQGANRLGEVVDTCGESGEAEEEAEAVTEQEELEEEEAAFEEQEEEQNAKSEEKEQKALEKEEAKEEKQLEKEQSAEEKGEGSPKGKAKGQEEEGQIEPIEPPEPPAETETEIEGESGGIGPGVGAK